MRNIIILLILSIIATSCGLKKALELPQELKVIEMNN